MGLGKTLQSITFLASLKAHSVPTTASRWPSRGPYLVVSPLSVLSGWQDEFRKVRCVTRGCTPMHQPTSSGL